MKAWWQQQSARDRRILLWGGVLAVILLAWALILDPLNDARDSLRQNVSSQRATRLWLEQVEQMLLRQPQVTPAAAPQRTQGGSLLRLVDDTVRAQGMAAAIERMEPDTPGQVRLWLRDAEFDTLVQWMESVSREHGVHITQAQISRDSPGQVSARLLVNDADSGD